MTESVMQKIDPGSVLTETDRGRKIRLIERLVQQCRVDVFDVIHQRGNGHWGGSASAAELLGALYFEMMNLRPDAPDWPDRDRLVLSKGHAAPMLYAMLANRGYFDPAELQTLRCLDSRLQGHPCMSATPGVEMSTGALGHGVSVGLGMALAARLQGRCFWTFVMTGDGCLNEGNTWEGIMAAAKFRPERLVLMIDYNRVQLDGPSEQIMPLDPLDEKLRAFGWNVAPEPVDGHSVAAILDSWDWMQRQERWPLAVIYQTHKGRGVSFMEDQSRWHGAPIDQESYEKGRPELVARLEALS